MRRFLALPALCLLALAACGDKGGATGGGDANVVGAWEIDVAKTVDNGLASAKRGLEKVREELAKLSPEVRASAEARMPKDDGALRADVEQKTRATTLDLDLQSDGTAHIVFKAPFGASTRDGVWEQKGDDVWITTKTKDGSPATEKDAEPQRFARRDGGLVLLDPAGNQVFWLRRK